MKPINKKYSDYIDFPVEIVGKDGVVRYYTFEESVSLYQRRIRLARLRYDTPAERKRELEHCSNRIAQLRRSFFARYGWESFKLINNLPQDLSIELSGELSAYLRRQFGCGIQQTLGFSRVFGGGRRILGVFHQYSRLARDVVL